MKFLELFAGSCSVSKAFAARGWKGVCVDLKRDIDPPAGFEVWIWDVLNVTADYVRKFDFAWASSPCEEFSVWGMRCFHPNPPYPKMGIRLFNHTREILETSGVPYVMENVRSAQKFIGPAVHHVGSFYLWGNAVPPLLPPRTAHKNIALGSAGYNKAIREGRSIREARYDVPMQRTGSKSKQRQVETARAASIPAEIASCVADYAERILEARTEVADGRE